MKTTFSAAAGLALALAVGGVATAQTQAPEAPQRAQRAAQMAQPVSQADFVQRRVERLRAADSNGDGQVTAEEMRTHAQARRAERQAAAFDRLDANKDGALSRAEFDAPRGQMRQGQRQGMNRSMNRGGENRFPVVIADAERKASDAFVRMDANRDGSLSVEERRAAMQASRAEMRQKREERRMERRPEQRPGAPAAASPSTPASE